MAIEKANKLRNVTNVAKELLKDPTQTEREVAEKLFTFGGSTDTCNLQVLCSECNLSKGNQYSVSHL